MGLASWPSSARAQDAPEPFALPWTDVPPSIDRSAGVVRAAAVGMPDERIGRFAPRRDSARESGRRRALAMLHAWVDDALRRVNASPAQADAAHRAVESATRVRGIRPLADAGAVVAVELPLSALRGTCARDGVPW